MLESYVEKAEVQDGMEILDLGCGWGSLGLFLAAVSPLWRRGLTVEIPEGKSDEPIEQSLSESVNSYSS